MSTSSPEAGAAPPEPGGPTPPVGELPARQNELAIQRTRMSADRTLMSMLRTSISLVSFGFTIAQFFARLRESERFAQMVGSHAPRNFGLALVFLGNGLLAAALVQHVAFLREMREDRALLVRQGVLHGEGRAARSVALYVALIFLLLSLVVVLGMVFRAGPFD